MDVLTLVSIIRLYPKVKAKFLHKIIRKIFHLNFCYCLDKSISLREVDQKLLFGGKIGYGELYLDCVVCYSKTFRLHARLHDATRAVRLQTGTGTGYCYSIGRRPNWFLLGLVTGLVFCLYVKLFQRFFFQINQRLKQQIFDFSIYRANPKNIMKELGLFIDGNIQGFSFCPPKHYKPNKQTTWNTNHLHGITWSSRKLEYDNFFDILHDLNTMNSEVFVKFLKSLNLLSAFLVKCRKLGRLWLSNDSKSRRC